MTAVNQQLGNAKGLVGTTETGLTTVSNLLATAKGLLVNIANSDISQDQRNQYVASYKSLVQQVANAVDGSTYNGQTLVGQTSGAVAGTAKSVINNENGATSTLSAEDVSGLANTLAGLIGSTFSRTTAGVDSFGTITAGNDLTAAATALTATTGTTSFSVALTGVDSQLNQIGSDSNFLTATITANSNKIDSLNAGVGSLVDADLSKESAKPASPANPAAAGHAGAVDRQPGPANLAEPVQVSAQAGGVATLPARLTRGTDMSNLVLELRQGEVMVINGAPIRFRTKSRIELTAHARFLFGKQIMRPAEADTPARRIYFALQSAYIGTEEERPQGLATARELCERFKEATTSALARDILDRAITAAGSDQCYLALKLARRIIRHEDTILGRAEPAGSETMETNACVA